MIDDDAEPALRADAESILRAAIAAADPAPHVRAAIRRADELRAARHVHVIAVGKAAASMAAAALDVLEHAPAGCLVVIPEGAGVDLGARTFVSSHPLPDARSVAAGEAIAESLARVAPDDVALVLLSGGASSLAVLPRGGIGVDDYATCVELLMRAGATIEAVNTVRGQIDALKAGGMAARIQRAHVLGLVLSDVIGDPLHVIASGPLTPHATDAADALAVLDTYEVLAACPPSIRTFLERRPVRRAHDAAHVRIDVVANNRTAVEGAATHARALGYNVHVLPHALTGESRDAGRRFAEELRAHKDTQSPACILAGGETTVTVRGDGKGGRNQELALAAALALCDERSPTTIGSLGTDGVDGPTDAAGAICAPRNLRSLREQAEAALERNDSYTLLDSIGALVRTGPTGTNVADVQIGLIGEEVAA